jgi:hypothetical protein
MNRVYLRVSRNTGISAEVVNICHHWYHKIADTRVVSIKKPNQRKANKQPKIKRKNIIRFCSGFIPK